MTELRDEVQETCRAMQQLNDSNISELTDYQGLGGIPAPVRLWSAGR
ncbi:hypothetical protein M8494_14440 [Serratia ureilytica]